MPCSTGPIRARVVLVLWASLFRSGVALVAAAGLSLTWIAMSDPLHPLVMFTVQSNLLLVAYCCVRVVRPAAASAEVKGVVTLSMLVTGLVWHFLRMGGTSPFADLGLDLGLGNFLLHYVTPALAVADWLVLDRGTRGPRWAACLGWLAFPAAYLVFVLVRGALLPPDAWKRYPYPFLDVGRLGYEGVAYAATGLTLAFTLLGLTLIAARRATIRTGRTARRPAEEAAAMAGGSQAGL